MLGDFEYSTNERCHESYARPSVAFQRIEVKCTKYRHAHHGDCTLTEQTNPPNKTRTDPKALAATMSKLVCGSGTLRTSALYHVGKLFRNCSSPSEIQLHLLDFETYEIWFKSTTLELVQKSNCEVNV